MRRVIKKANRLEGTVRVPGDKSISHRSVIFGSIAEGVTTVTNFARAEDPMSTVKCMRALGVEITEEGDKLYITGRGIKGLEEPEDVLDAGNSGTTMRLLLGLLAGQDFFSVITGDGSLRRRPMGRVTAPLTKMGAFIMGRKGGKLAPLAIRGSSLKGIKYTTPVASAQVKSALILAALTADGVSIITEPGRSRDHTERMLTKMGADIRVTGKEITVHPGNVLKAQDITIPGDFSSAAFFLAAGCLLPEAEVRIVDVNVNDTRAGLLQVLREMGANIEIHNERETGGEPIADLVVTTSSLRGTVVGGEIIPSLIDEIPVLAVAAAVASGRTVVRDAAELRVKESDRIAAMVSQLGKMGADIRELSDGFEIDGGRRLHGTVVDSHGDHRIAMSLAVAGLLADGETVIENWDCVGISFPSFADILDSLSR